MFEYKIVVANGSLQEMDDSDNIFARELTDKMNELGKEDWLLHKVSGNILFFMREIHIQQSETETTEQQCPKCGSDNIIFVQQMASEDYLLCQVCGEQFAHEH